MNCTVIFYFFYKRAILINFFDFYYTFVKLLKVLFIYVNFILYNLYFLSILASFDKHFPFCMLYYVLLQKKRGVNMSISINQCAKKCGTITVSVYKKYDNNDMSFWIEADNDSLLPISYVIEDTLKQY